MTLIYSMSLNGEYSITLASLRYISDTHKDDTFEELIMPKNGKLTEDMLAKFKDADLVMLASSLYHFSFSSQAMDSLNVIGRYLQQNSPHKPVTLFTTSGLMMDNLPHELVRKWADRYGLRYIKGDGIYSADMLNEKYRADVYAWYHSVRALVTAEDLRIVYLSVFCIFLLLFPGFSCIMLIQAALSFDLNETCVSRDKGGSAMDLYCQNCGAALAGERRFCPNCGAPAPAPNASPGNGPGTPAPGPYDSRQPFQPARQAPQPWAAQPQQPAQPWAQQQAQPWVQQQAQPWAQQPQPRQWQGQPPTQQPVPQQPIQRQQPAPQRQAPPSQAPQPQPKKKGKGGLVAVLVSLLVIGLGVTAFFGFREGGFLRGGKDPQSQGGTPDGSQGGAQAGDQSGTNTGAMLDYAKRLEEMGNPEAAAAIYEKLRLAGQADLNAAMESSRDDPERLMLDALRGEDLYRTLSGETKEAELPFSDVDAGKYYYAAALWAKEAHIVFGDALLPGEPLTRGDALLFLWRARGRPVPGTTCCPYEDVEKFGTGYDAILWALGEGLITPQADGLLHLEEPAQRAQAVTFLYGAEGRPDTAWSEVFDDVKESSYYALPAIWAAEKGAVSQGSFRPKDPCTRAEFVVMLLRLYG